MVVIKTFHIKDGVITRECTPQEIAFFREINDRDVLREDFKLASTVNDKLQIIAKALRLI